MFNVEEQNLLAVLHAESREATIADIRMMLDNIDDLELEEVCLHTLNKLMRSVTRNMQHLIWK